MRFGVSVWIPNRNHAKTLGAAVHSAIRENPVEVLVIDDASTDDSVRLMYAANKSYPQIGYVQHREKSGSWEKAACPYIAKLKGQHIVSLSADDELLPYVFAGPIRHRDAAVVFHSYLVRKPGRAPHGTIPTFTDGEVVMSPRDVQERFLGKTLPMETGIGSALRHDWQQWLIDQDYWRMGPFADAIGFATVAAIAGAVYIPSPGAVFTEDDASYGARERNGPDASRWIVEVWAFLRRAEMPPDVAAALCRKRGIPHG